MKRIILAVALSALALSCTPAKEKGIERVQVTSQAIASQPGGKPYVIELTRDGSVYNVAADIDYSRVIVRTSAGEEPMSEVVKRLAIAGTQFLVGSASDLDSLDFGFPPGDTSPPVSEAKCNGLVCGCTGAKDCKDLKKKYSGAKFYCGEAPAQSGSDSTMASYGRKPGTYGCVMAQPQ